MTKHEQSYADIFNAALAREVEDGKFHSFSVDGQDRDAGCDYVISDSDRFAIIEFKWTEKDLPSEARKGRRLELCVALQGNEEMRRFHDKCHFISWSNSGNGKSQTNIYRKEICTQEIFGTACGLNAIAASSTSRVGTAKFADDFFVKETRSLTLSEFEIYLAWVMKETSGSKESTIELLAYKQESGDVFTFKMKSLAEAQAWMKAYKVAPSSKHSRKLGPS